MPGIGGALPPLQGFLASSIDPARRSAVAQNELGLAVDVVRDYNASGSAQSTTGSISAGSNVLTLASAIDFKNGQGISIANAGPMPTISAPTAATATAEGTTGSTTIGYAVAALDGKGGVTASFAFSVTNANATLSSTNYVALSVTAVTNAAGYAWYRTSTNGTSPTTTGFIGVTSGTSLNDTGLAVITPPIGVPASAPSSALGDLLVTSITAGAGTTILTLAASASTTVTGAAVNHNDTAAIQAAFAASLRVHVPQGIYNMSGTVTPQLGTFLECESGAIFDGTNAPGDAFQLVSGNWNSRLRFGKIQNYLFGAAIHALPGASVADVWFDHLKANKDGLLIESSSAGNSLDDNWSGIWITSSTYAAIHIKATNSSDAIQGHIFRINLLDINLHSILFDAPSGITPSWNTNVFHIPVVDGGNIASSTGISTTNSNGVQGCTFNCEGFFGGFKGYYVNLNGSNNNQFKLALNTAVTATTFIVVGVGNKILSPNFIETPAINTTPIAMATASGSQASFNGGALLNCFRAHLSITVGALSAGATADFYAYHAFTQGYGSLVRAFPRWNVPLIILTAEDESIIAGTDGNTSANQIHIRVYAVAAVPAGTYNIDLEVE